MLPQKEYSCENKSPQKEHGGVEHGRRRPYPKIADIVARHAVSRVHRLSNRQTQHELRRSDKEQCACRSSTRVCHGLRSSQTSDKYLRSRPWSILSSAALLEAVTSAERQTPPWSPGTGTAPEQRSTGTLRLRRGPHVVRIGPACLIEAGLRLPIVRGSYCHDYVYQSSAEPGPRKIAI